MNSFGRFARMLVISILLVFGIAALLHIAEFIATHSNLPLMVGIFAWLSGQLHKHDEALVLLVGAGIACLPVTIPYPFDQVPAFVWLWDFFRRTVQQFANMRYHPDVVQAVHTEHVSQPGLNRTVTDKIQSTADADLHDNKA
jgi:hypothetical protein